ncbi:peptidyl-prolyl cis-trans isomerase [Pseudohalioglobus lutimaris]|uniref:Peptidyl-prolyl cis-trans isomerase n=1 Tax=Pseudohalioglobus lutimaris TaxID=1737061 RepID=A0A2N5WYI3_9GAMM|nr:peptidyl-prolyl cis-trans isomerase [Pseudohalioglobus lutimaris]PLW67305.1 peptidyl-prolyl cis-trans isomerase [Pseudohalioglobus lutimaris]
MRLLSWLNRPWIHFLVLGIVLFWARGKFFPEPLTVVGPLSEARLETLQQQWFSTVGRMPSEEQLQRMADAELDRDMMFQRAMELELHLYDTVVYQRLLRNMHFLQLAEGKSDEELYEQALEMRLHLGDEVIKRRMIQVVEQLMLASNPPAAPTEAEVRAEFEQRRDELRRPPRYTIEHLYFSREREDEVSAVIERVLSRKLSAEDARQFSSPFLPGYRFVSQTPDQLARHFGAAFVDNLEEAGPRAGEWVGPVRSTYGLHYVFVSELEPGRDAELEEVRKQLERDLVSRARTASLAESIEALRENYEVRR